MQSLGALVTFCVIYGILSGLIITMATIMVPVLAPDGARQDTIGTRLGMSYFSAGVGLLVGSPIAGAVSNARRGDFVGGQAFGGATLLAGAVMLIYPWMIVRRKRTA